MGAALQATRATGARCLTRPIASSYCELVKNITVSVDDDTYRRARIAAAAREQSVSALVREYLQTLASGESENDRLKRQEREVRDRIHGFSGSDRLSRDEIHERGVK